MDNKMIILIIAKYSDMYTCFNEQADSIVYSYYSMKTEGTVNYCRGKT